MAAAPKIPTPVRELENILAFRTKVGAETVKGGETKDLANVETGHFDKIRLVADERAGSTCNVLVRLTFMEGNELVAFMDTVLLTPHAQITRVYDVPGTKINVAIDGIGAGNTNGSVDVLLYGQF